MRSPYRATGARGISGPAGAGSGILVSETLENRLRGSTASSSGRAVPALFPAAPAPDAACGSGADRQTPGPVTAPVGSPAAPTRSRTELETVAAAPPGTGGPPSAATTRPLGPDAPA